MPIAPPSLEDLADAYQRVNDEVNSLQDAALAISSPAAREVLCSAGGALSLGFGRLARISSPGFADLGKGVGGLLERACEIPPPLPEEPSPPFEGGQCEGILYTLRLQFDLLLDEAGNQVLPRDNEYEDLVGPVGAPFLLSDRENGELNIIRVPTGAGIVQLERTTFIPRRFENLNVVSVTRQDGLPDECGSLPPPPPPDRPPIIQPPPSPPIPRVDPDGNPLPDLIFAPRVGPVYVDVDGSLNIPVDVNVSGPDIDLNIPVAVNLGDFSPTIVGVGGGGGSGPGEEPGPPPQICCPGPPPRTRAGEDEDPDEEPEEPPKDMAIAAVIVSSEPMGEGQSNSTIFTATPPLLVPRIGTVQFEVEVDGQRFIGPDVQLKQTSQFVEAPTAAKVTRAFVKWEPGWTGSFQYLEKAINEPFPTISGE